MPRRKWRACAQPGCPELTDKHHGRCASHAPQHTRTTSQRGYGALHQKLARAQIRQQPWCSDCGHEGSDDNPLTGEHIVRLADGGPTTASNYTTLCRRCNSRRARLDTQR